MDVSYIQPVEGNLVGVRVRGFWIPSLAVLLRLGKLSDDGNTQKFLACKLYGLSDRFFLSEFNISNSKVVLALFL